MPDGMAKRPDPALRVYAELLKWIDHQHPWVPHDALQQLTDVRPRDFREVTCLLRDKRHIDAEFRAGYHAPHYRARLDYVVDINSHVAIAHTPSDFELRIFPNGRWEIAEPPTPIVDGRRQAHSRSIIKAGGPTRYARDTIQRAFIEHILGKR